MHTLMCQTNIKRAILDYECRNRNCDRTTNQKLKFDKK